VQQSLEDLTSANKQLVKSPTGGVAVGTTTDPRFTLTRGQKYTKKIKASLKEKTPLDLERYLQTKEAKPLVGNMDIGPGFKQAHEAKFLLNTLDTPNSISQGVLRAQGIRGGVVRIKALESITGPIEGSAKNKFIQKLQALNPFSRQLESIRTIDPRVASNFVTLEDSVHNTTQELQGFFIKQLRPILTRYSSTDPKIQTKFRRIAMAVDSGDLGLLPTNPEAMETYNQLKEFLEGVGLVAEEEKVMIRNLMGDLVEFLRIKNYYPRGHTIPDYTTFNLQKILKESTDEAGNLNIPLARQALERKNITLDPNQLDLILNNYTSIKNPVRDSFQKSRTYKGTLQGLEKAGVDIEINPTQILDYAMGMAESISRARHLGGANEKLIETLLQVENVYGIDSRIYKLTKDYVDRMGGASSPVMHEGLKLAQNLNRLLFTLRTPLYQLQQGVTTASEAGLGNLIQSIAQMLSSKQNRELIDIIEEFGATTPQYLDQQRYLLG
jgi:hypothetical protein